MITRLQWAGCILGAAGAVIALLAGCGGEGPGSGTTFRERAAVDIAREAPDITRAAGSSRFSVEMTYSSTGGLAGDSAFTMSGIGAYDYERQIGEARITTDAADLSMPPQEAVFRGNVTYQRDVGASRWQERDLSDHIETPIGQHDPSRQLDLLRGVSDDVREVGTADVRGDEVVQYAITIDPVRLSEANGVVVDGGLTQAALQATGPMPGDVYVDADGRVRRLVVQIETSGAALAASPGMSELLGSSPEVQEALRDQRTSSRISIDYFDFGVPVTTQLPDPATVDRGPLLPMILPGN